MKRGRGGTGTGTGTGAKTKKGRLDLLLVERGLAGSREGARALILAGRVRVEGRPADKAGAAVPAGARVELVAPLPFVSRGGIKLRAALEAFEVRAAGRVALDVGASTGGFTDCLLQAGASRVYAVDVGFGQLDQRLRRDPRVVVLERTNIRHLGREGLTPVPDLATIDVSFISLGLVLPAVAKLLEPPGEVVALVKPQFEVGKGQVGKGGVVRDAAKHRAVLFRIGEGSRVAGFEPRGVIPSPILGPKGNQEFLIHLVQRPKVKGQSWEGAGPEGSDWAERVEACLAAAAGAAKAGRT